MWSNSRENGIYIAALHTSFRRTLEEDEVFDGERHDFWELVFLENGSLTVAEDERIYEMTANQIILHKPMEFHRFWAKKDTTTKILVITFSLEGDSAQPLGDGIFSVVPKQAEQLIQISDMIKASFGEEINMLVPEAASDRLKIQAVVMKLQMFLIDLLIRGENIITEAPGKTANNYRKIVNVLNEHVYENLSVTDISKLTLLSVSNLKKSFNLYSGCGVMRYFNSLKIQKAIEMLHTEMSIAEISHKLGYITPNYFSVVFKRETGMSPSEYRNRQLPAR